MSKFSLIETKKEAISIAALLLLAVVAHRLEIKVNVAYTCFLLGVTLFFVPFGAIRLYRLGHLWWFIPLFGGLFIAKEIALLGLLVLIYFGVDEFSFSYIRNIAVIMFILVLFYVLFNIVYDIYLAVIFLLPLLYIPIGMEIHTIFNKRFIYSTHTIKIFLGVCLAVNAIFKYKVI